MNITIEKRTSGVFHSVNNRLAEWSLGVMMSYWGIVFILTDGIFERPPYKHLASLVPPTAWVSAMLTIGFGRLSVLVLNGSLSKSPHLRTLASLASGTIWLQLALSFFSSEATWLLPGMLVIFSGMDFIAMLRAARDARISDGK